MGWGENEYTAATDEWGTPDEVLEPIYANFGTIGLDPCANPGRLLRANKHIIEARDGDGIEAVWDDHGLVFVNPPFSDCARWVWKAHREGDEVILLLPVRTSNQWWKKDVWPADVIMFWSRRMKFAGAKHIAPFHVALVYWGQRKELFLETFPEHPAFVYKSETERDFRTAA